MKKCAEGNFRALTNLPIREYVVRPLWICKLQQCDNLSTALHLQQHGDDSCPIICTWLIKSCGQSVNTWSKYLHWPTLKQRDNKDNALSSCSEWQSDAAPCGSAAILMSTSISCCDTLCITCKLPNVAGHMTCYECACVWA